MIGISVLVAGAIHNNKPMLIGATIGIIASGIGAVGIAFATRPQNMPITNTVSFTNPLISNV